MAGSVTAKVCLGTAHVTAGHNAQQGLVIVSNNATGQPVQISSIVCWASPVAASVTIDQPQLGGGGGGAGYNTIPSTIPTVVNNNASLAFPVRFVAYGAMAPGASPVNAQICATVTLSDGTTINATPAQLTVDPLMRAVSDGGVLTPLQNPQPTAGQFVFSSTLNSDLVPLFGF